MFGCFLDAHVLREMLIDKPLCLFPSMDDREAWGLVDSAEIRTLAEEYRGIPYPMRQATDFLAFVRSGSRKADENPYFLRRRKLCIAALNCCITGQLDDLDDVVNGLWCICEESSWVISAHNINPVPDAPKAADVPLPDPDRPYIDLFTAQTGMILSLVCSLMGRQLDEVTPMLRQLVQREIQRRILIPFMERNDFWWMGFLRKDLCNWTPWIVSNVLLTAALSIQQKDALARLIDRGLRMVDSWLDCVPDDGGCDEGAGYWNMAGGALLDCLELMEKLTAGKMTFWHQEKVRNILQFPANAYIGNGWFVNFADCDARPLLAGERMQLAGEKLENGELMALGTSMRGNIAAQLSDTPQLWRALNLLFHSACDAACGCHRDKAVWLPELQLRVQEKDGFLLCCKGGHNGESHNHNDVGSFMLYVDDEPVLVDAGNMVYTAKTFSEERYTLWNTRSAYHNLPIIGGCEQQPGKAYAARNVLPTQGGLRLDMAGAYEAEAGVESALRHVSVSGGSLYLRDRISLKRPEKVCWVFMLRSVPILKNGEVCTGDTRLLFDPQLMAEVTELPITDARMAKSFQGNLWRLTLTAHPSVCHDQIFRVERT